MRYLVFLFFISLFFASCKKENSTPNSAVNKDTATNKNPIDSTISFLASFNHGKDSFIYDSRHRLSQIIHFENPHFYQKTTFSFPIDSAVVPAYYTLVDSANGITEVHILSYDNQNRIIKDTCGSATYVAYFRYLGTDTILAKMDFLPIYNDPSYDVFENDTLLLSRGNIIHGYWANSYTGFGGYGYLPSDFTYTSHHPNPAYNSIISKTIGPLLSLPFLMGTRIGDELNDFISKDMYDIDIQYQFGAVTHDDSIDSYTLDSKGNIIQFNATETNPNGSGQYTCFFSYY